MRDHDEIERVITQHGDTVWRVCMLYFRQQADAQDAFQDTLIKFATYEGTFQSEEHIKAWLIRVATNVCKDMLKSATHTRIIHDDGTIMATVAASQDASHPESTTAQVIEAMQALTDPPRTPVYLALYEGYPATEIATMLDMPVNTVYSHISRGRKLLKEALQ